MQDPKQPHFEITADAAKLSGDRDNVWFTGSVHAKRDAEPAKPGTQSTGAATLTTEYLHVLPRVKRADSDQAVTVGDARGTINAVGMNLDADKGTINFLSHVRGTVAPPAAK